MAWCQIELLQGVFRLRDAMWLQRAAGLPVPAQIGIAVVATLVGVVAVVAAVWVFLSQRRRGRMPSGATLFAAGHEGKNGVGPEARHACSFLTCSSPLPVSDCLMKLLAARQGHKSKDRSGPCPHDYFHKNHMYDI